jgi:hypothetical protein
MGSTDFQRPKTLVREGLLNWAGLMVTSLEVFNQRTRAIRTITLLRPRSYVPLVDAFSAVPKS